MYAATENHSILTIFKWERRHARSFLTMPRTADQQNPGHGNRSRISAMAPPVCQQRRNIVCRFNGARLPRLLHFPANLQPA